MENLTENRMQKYLVEAVSKPGILSAAYSAADKILKAGKLQEVTA